MKILAINTIVFPLHLKEPYTIAYETISSVSNILLTIDTIDGQFYGVASPDKEILGETIESTLETVQRIAEPFLVGEDIESTTLREELFNKLIDRPVVRALFDIAFHDYDAKKARLPLYKYLGSDRDHISTAVTVFIHPLAETIQRVINWKKNGFSHFKIKGGISVQDDIDKLHAIRHAIGSTASIIFDANQGFSYEESLHFLRETRLLDITIIEQPTCKKSPLLLHSLYEATQAPIMADECICSLDDIRNILDFGSLPYINIKLMKIGRLGCAKKASLHAAKKGTQVIIGCMDECALLIATSLHLALSLQNVPFVDLDSFLDYDFDPTGGTVILENGRIRTNEKIGLGFSGLK